jgi:hypothetical protein
LEGQCARRLVYERFRVGVSRENPEGQIVSESALPFSVGQQRSSEVRTMGIRDRTRDVFWVLGPGVWIEEGGEDVRPLVALRTDI